MDATIRKADEADLDAVELVYSMVHDQEEAGEVSIGWDRAIYPTRATAEAALARGDLYVEEADGEVVACAIINSDQPDGYERAAWRVPAEGDETLVLHTLVVRPDRGGHGHAGRLVAFYEDMARELGCVSCRIDTNARNVRARAMYAGMGYEEVSVVPVTFNGIEGVQLVCLEKALPAAGARPGTGREGEEPRMGTRVAVMGIIVEDNEAAEALNEVLHEHASCIIGRMGIPYRERGINVISVALDATEDEISALAGKVGAIPNVSVKTAYSNVTSQA